jgi:hypothetical protein
VTLVSEENQGSGKASPRAKALAVRATTRRAAPKRATARGAAKSTAKTTGRGQDHAEAGSPLYRCKDRDTRDHPQTRRAQDRDKGDNGARHNASGDSRESDDDAPRQDDKGRRDPQARACHRRDTPWRRYRDAEDSRPQAGCHAQDRDDSQGRRDP